ncbi:MAG: hypothetical protein J5626_09325 [Lachnospiraceae bacterium]|nr:hypothetical protein [Lachnospiraceae bacterium]
MIKLLQKRREFLCAQIADCHRLIDAAPPGKLEICRDHSVTKWYVKPDKGERFYLPKKNSEEAKSLAKKRIAQYRLSIFEKELRAINLYLNNIPREKDYMNLASAETRYTELLDKKESVSWECRAFRQNPYHPELLKHPSPSGHFLRSKAECLIDMELYYRKIPFRYEAELEIDGEIFYPDFSFYNELTGEYKYWEHFGIMSDPGYRAKTIRKIGVYLNNGFIPGENIYFTYETPDLPLTMTTIDNVIDEIETWLYQY